MNNVLRFWLKLGASGFRINGITHLFKDDLLRDEPLTGRFDDPLHYHYTQHIYTKDLVCIK